MPRIPDTEIDRIKEQTDLAALVRSRGIELAKHGNGHLAGACPFHEDDEPSFIVTPAKGLYHCMGCGVAGNAIQFIEKFDGVSFRHAFELLSDGKGFTGGTDQPLKRATVPRLEAPVKPDAEDNELFGQVVDYYHERLQSPSGIAAREYLKSRGLDNEAALRTFRIGFADRTLGLRLPDKNRKDGKSIRTRLQKIGIIRQSGHEHFNGSIVLPIFSAAGGSARGGNAEGQCVEMYGRKIGKVKDRKFRHLYLPGPHAGIWNAAALQESEVILCEAPLDALTFWINGVRNVTFIYGTEGFTQELFDALLSHRVKAVRLAYDADAAGNRAAKRDAERLQKHGIEVYRIRLPHGMDVNEYAQSSARQSRDGVNTSAAKFLRSVVDSADWLGSRAEGENLPPEEPPQANPEDVPAHDRAHTLNNKLAANLAAKEKKTSANSAPPRETLSPTPTLTRQGPSALLRAGEYHTLALGERTYRVGGLDKNNSLDVLKISVRIQHRDDFHLDSFDMTRDGERRRYIERAAEETGLEKELIKRDLGKLLLALEEAQQQRLGAAADAPGDAAPVMTAEERDEALSLLKSPDLVTRISAMFDACGLVGEESNRLAAYLACTSRKLDRPLAVIIQSTSAAGKSTLMEAVLAMFPEEERVQYSAMTGQSLYYLGETNLKHKILAIVEEEGAEKASYALKLLQSEGELTIASTGKDQHTGRMETQEYHVEGPVMIFLTTTAIDIDEELQNRCLTLTVDESRAQTERIHTMQRQARTLEGLRLKKHRQNMLTLLRNVQRLLEPLDVVNPYADRLTFTAERTRTRRDHEKYLTLIDTIALLHQHQRERSQIAEDGAQRSEDGTYITVTLDDIELANRLAPELLGRSLDELPPQSRRVYEVCKQIVRSRMESDEIEQHLAFFSRREVRDRLGWGITQVRTHLERLRDMEFIAARYGRPGSSFQYELLTDCSEHPAANHIGLLDVEKLRVRRQPVGENANLSGGCRPPARQVQAVEKKHLAANLSAFSKRTSGTVALVEA